MRKIKRPSGDRVSMGEALERYKERRGFCLCMYLTEKDSRGLLQTECWEVFMPDSFLFSRYSMGERPNIYLRLNKTDVCAVTWAYVVHKVAKKIFAGWSYDKTHASAEEFFWISSEGHVAEKHRGIDPPVEAPRSKWEIRDDWRRIGREKARRDAERREKKRLERLEAKSREEEEPTPIERVIEKKVDSARAKVLRAKMAERRKKNEW